MLEAVGNARVKPLHFSTLQQAVTSALEKVRPGGVLVMAGAQALNEAASVVRRVLAARAMG